MTGMVDLRAGYGFKQVGVAKAIPHSQAMEMAARFRAKGMHGPASRAMALSRRSGRVQDLPKSIAFDQRQMRDKLRYRHEMALALRDEGMPWSPPRRRGVAKAEFQLSRNGENLLHLEKEAEGRAKHWGAQTRTLHVGSGKRRPAGRILLPTRKQWAAWVGAGAAGAAGAGGVKYLNRDNVKKREGSQRGRRVLGGVAGAAAGTAGALYTHHGALLIHGARRMARQGAPVDFKDFKEAMHPKQALGSVKEYPIPYVVPGAAGGAAGLAIGARRRKAKVRKRNDDRRRTVASIGAGTVAGVGTTDVANRVGGWATREGIKYHEQLVNAGKISHPMSRKARSRRLDEHKAQYGVGSNVNDAPQAYYRNWPSELPGARARKLMGIKNTPKVVAATLTAGGVIGGTAGGLRSRRRRQPVTKAMPGAKAQWIKTAPATPGFMRPDRPHVTLAQRQSAYQAMHDYRKKTVLRKTPRKVQPEQWAEPQGRVTYRRTPWQEFHQHRPVNKAERYNPNPYDRRGHKLVPDPNQKADRWGNYAKPGETIDRFNNKVRHPKVWEPFGKKPPLQIGPAPVKPPRPKRASFGVQLPALKKAPATTKVSRYAKPHNASANRATHTLLRFAKSYVPGKGYISASKVPRQELRWLAHGGRKSAQARIKAGERLHAKDVRENLVGARSLKSDMGHYPSTKRRVMPRVVADKDLDRFAGRQTGAFAFKTGGRKAPGTVFVRPGVDRSTLIHEHEHVTPKRSGYRLAHQIGDSPRKSMREEARADYLSGVDYKHNTGGSGYADAAAHRNHEAYQGLPGRTGQMFRRTAVTNYRHVQDKMRYAGTKTKVKKSYLPRAGGWVKATEVPKSRLRAGPESRYAAKVREKHETEQVRGQMKHVSRVVRGLSNPNPTVTSKTNEHRIGNWAMHSVGGGASAFAVKTGGPRSKGHVFLTRDTPRHILEHERAHLGPRKRSSYRMAQIGMNPNKRLREEARADYISGRHYADKRRPQDTTYQAVARNQKRLKAEAGPGISAAFNRKSVSQYRLVQNRMRAADQSRVGKVDTTMSDSEAHRLARRYDTRGPLPKKLSRDQKMKAYEARYIASGGRKAEKWKRRADTAEVGRNVGLAGATGGALLTLAARSKKLGPKLRKVKITAHRADNATIGAAAAGGAAELYGEHARSRRASYQNSPGGVAASALSRMQGYTPEKRKS